LVPHRFRAWFHHGFNGVREGPLQGFDVPVVVVNVAMGEGVADPPNGIMVDPDPK